MSGCPGRADERSRKDADLERDGQTIHPNICPISPMTILMVSWELGEGVLPFLHGYILNSLSFFVAVREETVMRATKLG